MLHSLIAFEDIQKHPEGAGEGRLPQWFPARVIFPPLPALQYLVISEDIFGSHRGAGRKRDATDIQWVEIRNAAKHSARHNKYCLVQNVNNDMA